MTNKKRCPFCGDMGRMAEYYADPIFPSMADQKMYTMVCAAGCCRMCGYSKSPEEALRKWNTRKGDA